MGVIRKRIRRFCHAHQQVFHAQLFYYSDVILCGNRVNDLARTVNFSGNGIDFFLHAHVRGIQILEFRLFVMYGIDDFARQFYPPVPAVAPYLRNGHGHIHFIAELFHDIQLAVSVIRKFVYRDHDRHAEKGKVFKMLFHIFEPLFYFPVALHARLRLLLPHPPVNFQRSHGNDKHGNARFYIMPAHDIEEFLGSQVTSEACLRNKIIRKFQPQLCCNQTVRSVGYVCERSAVNECGNMLHRLHDIGLESIVEQKRHRPDRIEV